MRFHWPFNVAYLTMAALAIPKIQVCVDDPQGQALEVQPDSLVSAAVVATNDFIHRQHKQYRNPISPPKLSYEVIS